MGHGREKKPDADNYRFIKETIKKKPLDKKKLICTIAAIAGGGVLFGICAAAVFVNLCPLFFEYLEKNVEPQEDVTITTPATLRTISPEDDGAEESAGGTDTGALQISDTGTDETGRENSTPLDDYEQVYSEALEVSEEPRKALVKVSGLSRDEDLLDDSFVTAGTSEGIIFWKTDEAVYLLTYADDLADAASIQITFTDGTTAVGTLCGTDAGTGLAVAKVKLDNVSSTTQKNISVAAFNGSYSRLQAKPVIAIGSPQGDQDAVVYGMVTSVTGKLIVADAEYNLMATDMHGSPNGTGVLLDTKGNVIGFIVKQNGENDVIRAYCIAQMKPLIEKLSNSDPVRYLGIKGNSITSAQRNVLNIPAGIYVDSVENESPAMAVGIQNGDIITKFDGKSITNMYAYTTYLQEMKAGEKVVVTLARKGADGSYADMEFELTIEKR